MKKFYITIMMALLPILIFSQGVNDNWYFGQNAAVNFTGSVPLALTDSQMYAEEATGTVSDDDGKILFYTNGVDIYDRQHQLMQDGTNIGGGLSTQQLAIVRNPANPRQYYIFTAAEIGNSNTYLAYTVVDMSLGSIGLNGHPLGAVKPNLKQIPIFDSSGSKMNTEAVTVVMHSDFLSFWIVIPNKNNLYSYRLSSSGFNPVPVVSSLGLTSPLDGSQYFGIKASPKTEVNKPFSNYISINLWAPGNNYMNRVYSFNNSSGQITSNFLLNINTAKSYVSEFSNYGKILYLGQDKIYAVNLDASVSFPVSNQIFSGASGVSFYGMQRNKYDDIYLNNFGSGYLSKINNPNTYGSSNVNVNAVYLDGKFTYLGLPQPLFWSWSGTTRCIADLALQNPETFTNHTYSVDDYIITSADYSTDASNGSIVMKADNYILLTPNTHIKSGSDFLAKIAPCEIRGNKAEQRSVANNEQKISLNLDLRDDATDDNSVKIYPNPVSDFLTIQSSLKVEKVSVYDISGKKINVVFTNNKVDVKNLLQGSYLLIIETREGKTTKKFIKK